VGHRTLQARGRIPALGAEFQNRYFHHLLPICIHHMV
jgi:hypothetical protein